MWDAIDTYHPSKSYVSTILSRRQMIAYRLRLFAELDNHVRRIVREATSICIRHVDMSVWIVWTRTEPPSGCAHAVARTLFCVFGGIVGLCGIGIMEQFAATGHRPPQEDTRLQSNVAQKLMRVD